MQSHTIPGAQPTLVEVHDGEDLALLGRLHGA